MPHSSSSSEVAARNVAEIARLEERESHELPLSDRISLAITRRVGTLWGTLFHAIAFLSWCLWNVFGPQALRFDPYPFGLLTMIVSMEGVLLATLVLVSQNRMSVQSDQRDRLNLQVDLLAEQEMTMVLRMLSRIGDRLGVQPADHEQEATQQLMEETNLYELMEELRRKYR
jgi:uncharacterized membrane protein